MHFKWYVIKRTKKLQEQYLESIDYVLAYYALMKHENILYEISRFSQKLQNISTGIISRISMSDKPNKI